MREALPENIPIHIHHGENNKAFAGAIAQATPNVHLTNMAVENLTINEYSNYMTRASVYEGLPRGHTIVFQTDSGMCDPKNPSHMKRLDDFVQKYDYVGSPWPWWTTGEVGGNGGISLRNVETMARLAHDIEARATRRHPEDVVLSRLCSSDAACRMPTVFEAVKWNNQHKGFDAKDVNSEIRVIDGARCMVPREDPIAFHKVENICHRAASCPGRSLIPHDGGANILSPEEVQAEIALLPSM
jgi:hypothetical protein